MLSELTKQNFQTLYRRLYHSCPVKSWGFQNLIFSGVVRRTRLSQSFCSAKVPFWTFREIPGVRTIHSSALEGRSSNVLIHALHFLKIEYEITEMNFNVYGQAPTVTAVSDFKYEHRAIVVCLPVLQNSSLLHLIISFQKFYAHGSLYFSAVHSFGN